MEALLAVFIAFAVAFVLVASSLLYLLGKKAFFRDRRASRLERLGLFVLSVGVSVLLGVALMVALDLR